MGDKVRITTLSVIAFGAAVTAGLELYLGFYRIATESLLMLCGFLLIGFSPYAALYWAARKMVSGLASAVFVLIATLLIVLPSVALYIDAIFIHLDAQRPLVLVLLPPYQLLGILPVFVALAIVNVIAKSKLTTTRSKV